LTRIDDQVYNQHGNPAVSEYSLIIRQANVRQVVM